MLPEMSTQVLERMSLLKPFNAVHVGVQVDGAFSYRFTDAPISAAAP